MSLKRVQSSETDKNIYASIEAEKEEDKSKKVNRSDIEDRMIRENSKNPELVKDHWWGMMPTEKLTKMVDEEFKRQKEGKPRSKEEILAEINVKTSIGASNDAMSGYDDEDKSQGRINRLERANKMMEAEFNAASDEDKIRLQELYKKNTETINNIKLNQEEYHQKREEIETTPSMKYNTSSTNGEIKREVAEVNKLDREKSEIKDQKQMAMIQTTVQNQQNNTQVYMPAQSSIPNVSIFN